MYGSAIVYPSYTPFSGPMKYLYFANSIGENRIIDASYQTTSFEVTATAGDITNQTYYHDNAYNFTGVTDTVSAANNQTFGFDVLNRLTSAASGTGGVWQLQLDLR